MTTDITEAEMRRALFGSVEISKPIETPAAADEIPKIVIVSHEVKREAACLALD